MDNSRNGVLLGLTDDSLASIFEMERASHTDSAPIKFDRIKELLIRNFTGSGVPIIIEDIRNGLGIGECSGYFNETETVNIKKLLERIKSKIQSYGNEDDLALIKKIETFLGFKSIGFTSYIDLMTRLANKYKDDRELEEESRKAIQLRQEEVSFLCQNMFKRVSKLNLIPENNSKIKFFLWDTEGHTSVVLNVCNKFYFLDSCGVEQFGRFPSEQLSMSSNVLCYVMA